MPRAPPRPQAISRSPVPRAKHRTSSADRGSRGRSPSKHPHPQARRTFLCPAFLCQSPNPQHGPRLAWPLPLQTSTSSPNIPLPHIPLPNTEPPARTAARAAAPPPHIHKLAEHSSTPHSSAKHRTPSTDPGSRGRSPSKHPQARLTFLCPTFLCQTPNPQRGPRLARPLPLQASTSTSSPNIPLPHIPLPNTEPPARTAARAAAPPPNIHIHKLAEDPSAPHSSAKPAKHRTPGADRGSRGRSPSKHPHPQARRTFLCPAFLCQCPNPSADRGQADNENLGSPLHRLEV